MSEKIVRLAIRDLVGLIKRGWFVPGPEAQRLRPDIDRPLNVREEQFLSVIEQLLEPGEELVGFFDNEPKAPSVDDALVLTDHRLIECKAGNVRTIRYGPIVLLEGPKNKEHERSERVPLVLNLSDGTSTVLLVPFGYVFTLMGFLKRDILRTL